MIIFNELKICDTTKKLIIDVSISSESYYTDVYIDQIAIDSQTTYSNSTPSLTPIFKFIVPATAGLVYPSIFGDVKTLRIEVEESQLTAGNTMDSTLFFVYVGIKGTPGIDTPSEENLTHTLKTVTNLASIYKNIIALLDPIIDSGIINSTLTDFILRVNGLDLALKTSNYVIAIKYWNKYFQQIAYAGLTNN